MGRPRPQASPARWALGGGRGPQGLVPQGDLTASARPGRDAEKERERSVAGRASLVLGAREV